MVFWKWCDCLPDALPDLLCLGIFETEERKHCLDLAKEAGLNVSLITKLVVENIRNANLPDSTLKANHQLEAVTSEVSNSIYCWAKYMVKLLLELLLWMLNDNRKSSCQF